MRLGDAERESLFEQLKRHAAAGRLDVEELERRVGIVAAAGTAAEAAAALADLPPVPGDSSPAARDRPRRPKGHGHVDEPDPGWQPTGERFRDPRTSRVMRVWVDPQGGRHYVPD